MSCRKVSGSNRGAAPSSIRGRPPRSRARGRARGTAARRCTVTSCPRNGTLLNSEPGGDQRLRRRPGRALRRAGGAAGEDDQLRRLPARGRCGSDPPRRSRRGCRRPARRSMRGQAAQPGLQPVEERAVLLVVDEQVGAFALGHLADLRSGEVGVEQDDLAPTSRPRRSRSGTAVVAGQQGQAVPGLNPRGPSGSPVREQRPAACSGRAAKWDASRPDDISSASTSHSDQFEQAAQRRQRLCLA